MRQEMVFYFQFSQEIIKKKPSEIILYDTKILIDIIMLIQVPWIVQYIAPLGIFFI